MPIIIVLFILLSGTQVPSEPPLFFDDFSYESTEDEAFVENGWIVRTEEGWPGVPGAIWSAENVTIIEDPDEAENRLVQMISSTDGETTIQTQICYHRKFLEGTYAARVHFSEAPEEGPDGDGIVQTFYTIAPLEFDLDPDYSEMDFEYLPNGGWGFDGDVFFGTTWETFRPEPKWLADNTFSTIEEPLEGWHTLVIQVGEGEVNYYIDAEHLGTHDGKYYPEVPMSINFNLWFINGSLINSDAERHYVEQIDWVYHTVDVLLSPEEVEEQVEELRQQETSYLDTVNPSEPELVSPCNF